MEELGVDGGGDEDLELCGARQSKLGAKGGVGEMRGDGGCGGCG